MIRQDAVALVHVPGAQINAFRTPSCYLVGTVDDSSDLRSASIK